MRVNCRLLLDRILCEGQKQSLCGARFVRLMVELAPNAIILNQFAVWAMFHQYCTVQSLLSGIDSTIQVV